MSTVQADEGRREGAAPRRARRRAPQRPFWERGYKSHGLWLGKQRLGGVEVEPGRSLEMKYRWQVGTTSGQSASLKEAKQRVEEGALLRARQLPLFDD